MSIAETIIQNAQFLERERDHWRECAEAAEESLERDRDDWNRMIDGKNVRIAELERELAESKSQPDLAELLEELEADKIVLKVWNTGKGGIGASLSPNQKLLIARKTFDFCAVNMEAMIAAIVKDVCESFPDSAFARRRREKNKSVKVKENEHWNPFAEAVKRHRTPWSVKHDGEGAYYMIDADGKHILDGQYDEVIPLEGIVAAVNAYQPANCSKTSNSSPAQPTPEPKAAEQSPATDAVEELLRRYPGEWWDTYQALYAIVSRYRAIEKAVNKYCDMYNNRDYLSRDFAREVCNIVRPLAKEAGR